MKLLALSAVTYSTWYSGSVPMYSLSATCMSLEMEGNHNFSETLQLFSFFPRFFIFEDQY